MQINRFAQIARTSRRALARLGEQRGFGLVEVLVASIAALIVVGAAMSLSIIALRSEPRISARSDTVNQARTTLERMTRELRQTYSVQVAGSTELSFFTYERVNGATTATQRFVSYRCDAGQCIRREGPVGQPLPETGTIAVDGVTNSDVFTYQPNTIRPEDVEIRFVLSIPGQSERITVDDGVNLRNATDFWD
jgi:Tfp pilus assembly protein PilW